MLCCSYFCVTLVFWLGCVSVKWIFNLFFRGKKILWGSIDWFVWNEHLKAASLCLCVWVQSHLMAQCLDYFSPDLANSSTLWFLGFSVCPPVCSPVWMIHCLSDTGLYSQHGTGDIDPLAKGKFKPWLYSTLKHKYVFWAAFKYRRSQNNGPVSCWSCQGVRSIQSERHPVRTAVSEQGACVTLKAWLSFLWL